MSLSEGDSAAGLARGWCVGADKLRGLGLLDLKVTSSRHVAAGGLGPPWQHVARKGPQEMDPAGTQASLAMSSWKLARAPRPWPRPPHLPPSLVSPSEVSNVELPQSLRHTVLFPGSVRRSQPSGLLTPPSSQAQSCGKPSWTSSPPWPLCFHNTFSHLHLSLLNTVVLSSDDRPFGRSFWVTLRKWYP